MSVRSRISTRASSAPRFAILSLVAALVLAGCSDGVFSPNQSARGQLQLRPVFSSVDWLSLTADINVIRLTASQLPARSLVQRQETSVDPTAAEWQLPLDLPVNSDVEVLVELINRVSTTDLVVYSGRTTIHVKGGPQPVAALVPVFPGPPDNLDITSLTITPKNQSLLEGDQLQITPTVIGSSNPTILWTSSDPTIVSVDASGVVKALALGQATIQAVAGPKSDNVTIDVGARAAAIQLTPTNITLAAIDDEVLFSAQVVDSRNISLNLPVTYQISDPSVAIQTAPGRFRARGVGEATITASANQRGVTISKSTTLTVQQAAVSLAISPQSTNISALGETVQFNPDLRDAHGNPVTGASFTWSSSTSGVATVDGNGTVTAAGNGSATIRVQHGTLSADATVNVQQVATSLTLAPNHVNLLVGEVFQLNAAAFDARGHAMAVDIAWSMQLNPNVAAVTQTGLVTALQKGSATVSATYGDLQAITTVTVKLPPSQVLFDRTQLNLIAGDSQQVTAYLAAADSTRFNTPVSYSSENPAIAKVSASGMVVAVAEGQTNIIATSQSFQARLPVSVASPPPAQIEFAQDQIDLVVYGSFQISAFIADANGNPVNGGPIVFAVVDPTICTVSATGLVVGLTAGQTEIIATSGQLQARIPVTVAPPPATQIIFDRPQLKLYEGQSVQISAFLADAQARPTVGDPIVYSSANPAVATVDAAGVVSGVTSGTTDILAQSRTLQSRLPVTVVVVPQGDVIVFTDLEAFDETPNAPSNRTLLRNLVTFTSGPRASADHVWLNYADPTNCAFCGKTFDFMRSEIGKTGLTVEDVRVGNGRLTAIPNSVKTLFVYAPNGSFTAAEAGLLKAFVGAGGRLVLIGGHGGSAAVEPFLNDALASLSANLRVGTTTLACGRNALPATSLRQHQVTAGMTEFRPGCTVPMTLGSGDIGLIYDDTNTIPIVSATQVDGGGN